MDMVTEKNNDVKHDFFNDPLRLKSDGAWLKVSLQAAFDSGLCLAFISRLSTILLGAWSPRMVHGREYLLHSHGWRPGTPTLQTSCIAA